MIITWLSAHFVVGLVVGFTFGSLFLLLSAVPVDQGSHTHLH